MSYYLSPSLDLPRDEKSPLLPERIETNIFPFPSIRTPGVPFPSIQTPIGSPANISPLSYYNPQSSPTLPRPVTDSNTPKPRWKQSLAWGSLQFATSGVAAFVGWDMIAGCALYEPNPIYAIERICSSSNHSGALLAMNLAILSSVTLMHMRLRPRDTQSHPKGVIATILFLGPVTAFLLGALGAFVVLGDLGPQGIAILHILSALCACVSVFTAVLTNAF